MKTEITAKIKEIENRLFYLNMKDNWTNKDYELDRKLTKELNELKKEYNDNKEWYLIIDYHSFVYANDRSKAEKIISQDDAVCQD